jgi:3-phenylpropionate/trans-cinnamate dioxygenase ferredoxin subunit
MWHKLAGSADVVMNGMKIVATAQGRILLIRTAKGLFALEDKCPHQEQTMDGGLITDSAVECPWHSVKMELASGKILNDMGFLGMPPMKTFPTKEEDGEIFVDFS